MRKKLKQDSNTFSITADSQGASIIIGEPLRKGEDIKSLKIKVNESVKNYDVLGYTTDINTMRLIFENKTFRSSSLLYKGLNDLKESQRPGVAQFAGCQFITCFTHEPNESVPFWMYYGNTVKKDKVLLQFRNFAKNFDECIRTDFAIVKDNKRCFFKSPEYGKTINIQHTTDTSQYDLRACINSISIFDIKYCPPDSPEFTKDNSELVNVDFSHIVGEENAAFNMISYDTTILGKHKYDAWSNEKETRILLRTTPISGFDEWDYIDLRLYDEVFRDMCIILSPWDDGTLKEEVQSIICNSGLPDDIVNSIAIKDSVLKGEINI